MIGDHEEVVWSKNESTIIIETKSSSLKVEPQQQF